MENRPIPLAPVAYSGQPHPEAGMRCELILIFSLLSSACARNPAAPAPAPLETDPELLTRCSPVEGSSTTSIITAAELHYTSAANLYDAIERLRPDYFNEPEVPIVVIVNRRVVGGPQELRALQATAFGCVRRLSAADVAIMTGTNAPAGGVELVYPGVSR